MISHTAHHTTFSRAQHTLIFSDFILYTSYFILHSSYFILHSSYFILHSSYFILHSSYFILHSSPRRADFLERRKWKINRKPSFAERRRRKKNCKSNCRIKLLRCNSYQIECNHRKDHIRNPYCNE